MIVGEIKKNATEKIIGNLVEHKDRHLIDIRVYSQPDEAEPYKWVPTKKGFNLNLDNWIDFKELIGKIDKAIAETA
jgi:hypothetical protein